MKTSTLHSVTYQHFENLQLSAQDFYETLKTTIGQYQFPDVRCEIRTLSDNGWFESKRLYLQVKFHSFTYNICAAPFGKNFFISWRLEEADSFWIRFSRALEGKKFKSFYELDTEMMFKDSITAIVIAQVEVVMSEHGFRQSEEPTVQ